MFVPMAVPMTPPVVIAASTSIPQVPFYSQFKDIQSPKWQQAGCGITDLAMLINYYKPETVTVNALLKQGIAAGAFDPNAGWIYAGLISLSQKYGLDGKYYDLSQLDSGIAFQRFKAILHEGPVILSVHYKFNPESTLKHLIVINGMDADYVYYNDPAAWVGQKKVSIADFLKGWKRKVIAIRPVKTSGWIADSTTVTNTSFSINRTDSTPSMSLAISEFHKLVAWYEVGTAISLI